MVSLSAAVSSETIKATVNGMVCGFCATAIEKTFRKQSEVETVNVNLNNRLVTVTTKDGQALDDAKVKKLVTKRAFLAKRPKQ